MEFVIVTGLSGAGKSRAINALEDIGFYCADNMPPKIINMFAELIQHSEEKRDKVAIVTDIRGGDMFNDLFSSLDELKNHGFEYKMLFLDSNNETIVRRYKETRRKHPLADLKNGSINEAINYERKLLAPARQRADYVIDTSQLSPAQLKERITSLFLGDLSSGMKVHCVSFGFKYGLPSEADLVFDVRCMPNPFYVDELKKKTGLDSDVREYVLRWPQAQGLIPKLFDLVDYLLPLYSDEGKSQLVVAIGCTGGRHRSVVFAELLNQHLKEKGMLTSVYHRDIQK